jgi:hypothetical protein
MSLKHKTFVKIPWVAVMLCLIIGLSHLLFAFAQPVPNFLIEAQTKTSASQSSAASDATVSSAAENKVITEADCTAEKLGTAIPSSAIGEPVSAVTLSAPVWTNGTNAAYCGVKGAMAPVDANAKAINFQVVLPASWNRRATQLGGGGMNGSIPNLLGGVDMGPGSSLSRSPVGLLAERSREKFCPAARTTRTLRIRQLLMHAISGKQAMVK